jgi:7,8-dihydro-6-hydroxymethylpterin-pyrophosphokinase
MKNFGIRHNEKFWNQAFVVIPLAEIYPEFRNPLTKGPIAETATRLRQTIWMETRPEVLSQFNRDRFKA